MTLEGVTDDEAQKGVFKRFYDTLTKQVQKIKAFPSKISSYIRKLFSTKNSSQQRKTNLFKLPNKVKAKLSQTVSYVFNLLFRNATSDTEKTKRYKMKREVFRQLKYALDKQGDKIQALAFREYEMKAYRKQLQDSKGWLNRDRFVLWASNTNDFGQNWFKPIYLLLFSTLFFYCLILLSIDTGTSPDFNPKEWSDICLKLLPQLLNPSVIISKMADWDKIKGVHLTVWTYLFDFLHKLILAFFIYQTIAAFRKYSGGKLD